MSPGRGRARQGPRAGGAGWAVPGGRPGAGGVGQWELPAETHQAGARAWGRAEAASGRRPGAWGRGPRPRQAEAAGMGPGRGRARRGSRLHARAPSAPVCPFSPCGWVSARRDGRALARRPRELAGWPSVPARTLRPVKVGSTRAHQAQLPAEAEEPGRLLRRVLGVVALHAVEETRPREPPDHAFGVLMESRVRHDRQPAGPADDLARLPGRELPVRHVGRLPGPEEAIEGLADGADVPPSNHDLGDVRPTRRALPHQREHFLGLHRMTERREAFRDAVHPRRALLPELTQEVMEPEAPRGRESSPGCGSPLRGHRC